MSLIECFPWQQILVFVKLQSSFGYTWSTIDYAVAAVQMDLTDNYRRGLLRQELRLWAAMLRWAAVGRWDWTGRERTAADCRGVRRTPALQTAHQHTHTHTHSIIYCCHHSTNINKAIVDSRLRPDPVFRTVRFNMYVTPSLQCEIHAAIHTSHFE